jgi:hypothetical protein
MKAASTSLYCLSSCCCSCCQLPAASTYAADAPAPAQFTTARWLLDRKSAQYVARSSEVPATGDGGCRCC